MITTLLRLFLNKSFKPFTFTNIKNNNKSLTVPKDFEVGIYVHIPFCTALCDFCPYNKVKYDRSLSILYKDALIEEINMIGNLQKEKIKISSVYFGGGSPALMIEELPQILKALKNNFYIDENVGIELHPRDISRDTISRLGNMGFDMISIGIQSFNEECLKTLGRDYINSAEKIKIAAEANFKTIDVDLIFGIKGQSKEVLKKDFETAFKLGATQVSTYPFIDFSYANNKNKPLGRKDKRILLKYMEAISSELKCIRTSVWTFGKKDTPKYSSVTRDNFIGFGPSATTLLIDFFKINTFSVEEYIMSVENKEIPTALTMNFNERTRALYWLFWNCYTLKINNNNFNNLFHKNIEDLFKFQLLVGRAMGLIKKTKEGYMLTDKGAYKYHLVEQAYTHQYIDKTWRIARNNPWPDKIKLY